MIVLCCCFILHPVKGIVRGIVLSLRWSLGTRVDLFLRKQLFLLKERNNHSSFCGGRWRLLPIFFQRAQLSFLKKKEKNHSSLCGGRWRLLPAFFQRAQLSFLKKKEEIIILLFVEAAGGYCRSFSSAPLPARADTCAFYNGGSPQWLRPIAQTPLRNTQE